MVLAERITIFSKNTVTMNLTKFLKLVDEEIKKMTVEETEKFLYEYARTLPENQREKFLKELREVQ